MLVTPPDTGRRGEHGVAMGVVVVVMILAMFVIVAIGTASITSTNRSKDAKDRSIGNAPIDAAVSAYQQALSTGDVTEATSFVFTQQALQKYVDSAGAGTLLLSNSSSKVVKSHMDKIDTTNIPSAARLTVATPLSSGGSGSTLYSYWQMYSLAPPNWGVTPGGSVVAYFRGWVANADGSGATKPVYVRAQYRGPSFSDFEIVSDGKMGFGPGAIMNGRVHSNGFPSSLQGQLDGWPQITFQAGVNCKPTAVVSSAKGPITAPMCGADQVHQGNGQVVNLLRVDNTVADIRATICGTYSGSAAYSHVVKRCFQRPLTQNQPYYVSLSGTSACVNSSTAPGYSCGTTIDAADHGPGTTVGAVLVFDHDVHIRGHLSEPGRITIFTSTRPGSGASLVSSSPSIYLEGGAAIGSSGGTSSAGFVAEGDVIVDETTACPADIRAALVAEGGLFSFRKPWRDPVQVAGGVMCNGKMSLLGSVSGHYSPGMISGINNAGYKSRAYEYDEDLYNNPPPMMVRTGDWRVERYSDADLSCFDQTSGKLILTQPGCGA